MREKNKDTASNKRPRESWNYTQTAKLVKLWKENINLIESNRCNEVWFTIRKELVKYDARKQRKKSKGFIQKGEGKQLQHLPKHLLFRRI